MAILRLVAVMILAGLALAALQHHIQGVVRFTAVIAKDGYVYRQFGKGIHGDALEVVIFVDYLRRYFVGPGSVGFGRTIRVQALVGFQ
jgi:hypothetical protein